MRDFGDREQLARQRVPRPADMGERRTDANRLHKICGAFHVLGRHGPRGAEGASRNPASEDGRKSSSGIHAEMTEDESDLESIRFGTVPFEYPRDERGPDENVARDLENAVRTAQWLAKLIYSGRTIRVQRMNASIGIALLQNRLNIQELSDHFHLTPQRIVQAVKKVKSFKV
jgi:hypothetical protein